MTEPPSPTAWQTLKSVLLTLLGVHSKKTTDQDIKGPSPVVYAGVFAVLVLIIMIVFASIVSSVVPDP